MHGRKSPLDPARIRRNLSDWAREFGFSSVGVATFDLKGASARLDAWLKAGHHGAMDYMARHAGLRADPATLLSGAASAISVRYDYGLAGAAPEFVLEHADLAYVSRYALGRDYHKVLRGKLEKLAQRLYREVGPFGYRVCVDSAPVFETELAVKAGIGWRGKHTLTLTRGGSWHFLGEILTDIELPADEPGAEHCGDCTRCIDLCPTGAIIGPYQVDARRCISYLTIEHPGSIPLEWRPALGNRIYGCDDCQLVCPWNRFAQQPADPDFAPRHGLDATGLAELLGWNEADFNDRLAGSPIRRIGWERWLRNVAVALGNALRAKPASATLVSALESRADHPSPLVREHVNWALHQRHERTD